MKNEIALEVNAQMTSVLGQLNESIRFVMENCTESEFEAFRSGVAKVMGALVLDVLNPLHENNPEAKLPKF